MNLVKTERTYVAEVDWNWREIDTMIVIFAGRHYAFVSPLKCSTLIGSIFPTKMLGLPQNGH